MKNDKRIRMTMEEIKMISRALSFYSENSTDGMPEKIKEARGRGEFTYWRVNTLGLAWRFDELASGGSGRSRKRFHKYAGHDVEG